jgi:hypothetical protein
MRFGRGGCERSACLDSDGDVCIADDISGPERCIAWIYQEDFVGFATWLRVPHGPFTSTQLCGASAKFNEDGSLHFWYDARGTIDGKEMMTRLYEILLTSEEATELLWWFPSVIGGLP